MVHIMDGSSKQRSQNFQISEDSLLKTRNKIYSQYITTHVSNKSVGFV